MAIKTPETGFVGDDDWLSVPGEVAPEFPNVAPLDPVPADPVPDFQFGFETDKNFATQEYLIGLTIPQIMAVHKLDQFVVEDVQGNPAEVIAIAGTIAEGWSEALSAQLKVQMQKAVFDYLIAALS